MSTLRVSLILLIIFVLIVFFSAHGARDFSKSLINGYEYVYFDKDGIMIVLPNKKNSKNSTVINSRVDDYRIEGDNILVARRPKEIYFDEQGSAMGKMLPICEFWIIDTKTHALLKVNNIQGLHCKPA